MVKVIPLRDGRGRFTGYYSITGAAEITPTRATAVKWAALENAARRRRSNLEA